jgi:c-di-GMP-binding flagellar brake protein YcgR
MSSHSIEFQEIQGDKSALEIVRNSFRIPIEDAENVFLAIDKIRYPVFDICPHGIGIIPEDNATFFIDEVIENCDLHIFDQLLKNLKARVIHCSLGEKMSRQCGFQWIDIDRQRLDQLNEIVLKMKDQLLK